MTKNVIAFVGDNANGILECQSRRFNELLAARGLVGHVLSVQASDFDPRLGRLLSEGVQFAWGYAGVGARLALGGQNLWSAARVPFISALFDPPYMMPSNHHVGSPYVVNGYIYPEWLELQRSVFHSPQIAGLLPMGVLPVPGATARWRDRTRRMVFVKTGGDPVRQRERWREWPPKLQTVLNQAADELTTKITCPIYPTVKAVLAANNLLLDGARPLLFGLLHELDTYMRTLRATTIAAALLPLPVDIVGDGWDHLRVRDGRARFHAPISAETLEALYVETKILVNASPNFDGGAHERVLRGFAARCRVLSDDNRHSIEHLKGLPSYEGFDWTDSNLADRLAAAYHDIAFDEDGLDAAQAYVKRHHDPLAFIDAMLALADVARLDEPMACYRLQAA